MQPTRLNHAQRGTNSSAPSALSQERTPSRNGRDRPANLPTPPLRRRPEAAEDRRTEQGQPTNPRRADRPRTNDGQPWSAGGPRQDGPARTDADGPRDERAPRRDRSAISPSGRVGAGRPTLTTSDGPRESFRAAPERPADRPGFERTRQAARAAGVAPSAPRDGARPVGEQQPAWRAEPLPVRNGAQAPRRTAPPAPMRPPIERTPFTPNTSPTGEIVFRELPATAQLTSFDELTIRPETRAAVHAMNITVPTPIQSQAIPAMLAGEDVVGQARTGSGKTLAFGLPLVERCDPNGRGVQALVLVPTRELAIQVGDVLEKLASARRLRLTLLYGGRSLVPEKRALAGGAQIVVGTPGRTLDHLKQGNLMLDRVRIFVLDEGDEMLDRGFAPDVERIMSRTPNTRQTALFSATVPPWVMQTAARHLHNPVLVRVDTTEAPPEIEHIVYDVDVNTRSEALRTLLDRRGDGPIIVFGRTKHGVKKLAKQLEVEGFPVVALHGNLSQKARERAMADLRSGNLPILVATNVAARGIDVADVGQVINYEVPESAELFTHRIGRTGRMGKSGEAITFVTPEEAPKWRQIERLLGKTLPRQPWLDGEKLGPEDLAAAAVARAAAPRPAPVPAADGEQRRERPRWGGRRPMGPRR